MATPVPGLAESEPLSILNGQSLSPVLNLGGRIPVGLIMPAAWTAANITVQACDTAGGTFVDVFGTAGAELALAAAASRYLAINPVDLYGVNFLRLRSGTSALPVAQAADRALVLMLARPFL